MPPPQPDEQVVRLMEEWCERRSQGECLSQARFIEEHPECAAGLRQAFALLNLLQTASEREARGRLVFAAGQRLGDFELLSEIGAGGMGVVYRARHVDSQEIVALKMLSPTRPADQGGLSRMRDEAAIMSGLDHPGIVRVHRIEQHQVATFLVMEYVDGGDLRSELRDRPLAPRHAANIIADVAEALDYVHDKKILHRDLKPSNILLGRDGVVRVTDFGLARWIERGVVSSAGHLPGTISYMSPEQAIAKASLSPTTDIFSLGVTLYECVTGRQPFSAPSMTETLRLIQDAEPVAPRRLNPGIPQALENIVLKCLEKHPGRRYASASALARDLRLFLDGQRVSARRPAAWRRAGRQVRRHPWITSIAVVLFCLAFAGAWARSNEMRVRAANLRLSEQNALQELQYLNLAPRKAGWSARARELMEQLRVAESGPQIRGQALATLAGLDGFEDLEEFECDAECVAFSADGSQALFGGGGSPPQLLDLKSKVLKKLPHCGMGPVAFSRDGRPWVFTVSEDKSLELRELAANGDVRRRVVARTGAPDGVEGVEADPLALACDASMASCVVTKQDSSHEIIVWGTAEDPWDWRLPGSATALAFSPDNALLAISRPEGEIEVYDVSGRTLATSLHAKASSIQAFAFGRNTASTAKQSPFDRWVLVTGDSGGMTMVWDLVHQRPIAICPGSHHRILGLAMNPDGTLVASCGRGDVRVWDAASGRLVLSLPAENTMSSVAFSPDGSRLASTARDVFGPAMNHCWRLEDGRGVESLRGLSAQIAKVAYSLDGRRLLAVSHDWRVAVWDLPTRRLLNVFQAPEGIEIDNFAAALSADGKRLAVTTGSRAVLWSVTDGHEIWDRQLPDGFSDQLAFRGDHQLISFRVEHDGEDVSSTPGAMPQKPYICRMRDLLAADWRKPLSENPDFSDGVYAAWMPINGRFVAVDGKSATERRIAAIDPITGKSWHTEIVKSGPSFGRLRCDPTGEWLAYETENRPSGTLFHTQRKAATSGLPLIPSYLSCREGLFLGPPELYGGSGIGLHLYFDGPNVPGIPVGMNKVVLTASFSPDGKQVALGFEDGAVEVGDIAVMRAVPSLRRP